MSSPAEKQSIEAIASDSSKNSNDDNTSNELAPDHRNVATGETRGDCQTLEQRFASIESKLKIVDNAFNLDQATEHFIQQKRFQLPLDLMRPEELAKYHTANLEFYWDSMSFMSKIRTSHQRILDTEKAMKEVNEEQLGARMAALKEQVSETARDISIKAFLDGVAATITQVDWNLFIATEGGPDDSILNPIKVVSSEPEPQAILRLKSSEAAIPDSVGRRHTEEILWERDQTSHGEKPLPERIKIHSSPLVAILCMVMKQKTPYLGKDKSMIMLRPFKELIFYETKLRDHLFALEKQFQDLDETQPMSTMVGMEDGSLEDSKHHPESGSVTDVPVKEADERETPPDDKKQLHTDVTQTQSPENEEPSNEVKNEAKIGSIAGLLHMRCLMNFFDNSIKVKLEYVDSPDCTSLSFHDLWHIFKPGKKVVDQTEKQAYVILRVQIPRHRVEDIWLRWSRNRWDRNDSDDDNDNDQDDEMDELPLLLHCVYIDFDGKQFGPVSKKFKIPQYGGLKEIRSLPVYPFRYAKSAEIHDKLRKRGKMLLDISTFKPMYYMGNTLDTRDEIDSQVVVDFNEALADETRRKKWEPTIAPVNTAPEERPEFFCSAPCCSGQAVHDGDYIDSLLTENYVRSLVPATSLQPPSLLLSPRSLEDLPKDGEGLTDEELMVMTYRVFGFVLRSRRWAQLDLSFLRYEDADGRNVSVNAFNRLELPDGHREMVKSLVIQHFRSKQASFTKDEQTDLIKGKGKGLIMLLHGAPGVGKTTTAEGIAELFKKPLFQITCGDLGTTAREVEEELEKNFALASRWGCILLLDEADVFLSARDRMDFVRNGLVAVFLRVLEYYTGILFLTTNRIGDFDEAFASRVHMSLYYPELDEQKTIRVFELNLDLIQDRFNKQGREIRYDASSIQDFARQHFLKHKFSRWNGRQIRNLCQTALALAEYDTQGEDLEAKVDNSIPVSLQLKYFKIVQEAYLGFAEYLGDIRGTKGDRRAIDFQLRARQDSPYQTRPSRFAHKAEEMASQDWQSPPTLSSSDSSQYRLSSQVDPFQPINQVHPLAGQGINMPPQQYQPYPYQQPQQQSQHYQQQPTTTMDSTGYNIPSGSVYVGHGNTDPRMMQTQPPNTQYMQYQQGSQGAPRNMNVNLQGSPVPQSSFPGHQQGQRYSSGPQGQGLTSHVQAPSISMEDSSSSHN
ncbi:hypothetical protein FSHL1_009878 [Fusarium sambucinum]